MSSTAQSTEWSKPRALGANDVAMIATLVVVDSLHLVVGRALLPYLHPTVSSMYLMGFGCMVVGAYALTRGGISLGVLRDHFWFFMAIGLLIGGSTVLTFTAVRYIDPGTGAMLSKLSVLISIGLGVLWLGERLNRRQIAGAALAIAGVGIITFQPGEYLRLGSFLVLAGTVMYALHTAIVKRYGDGIDFLSFFFYRLLATTAVLVAVVAVTPEASVLDARGWRVWALLIGAAVVDVAISRGLFYIALRRFTMTIHTIILTLSPAVTILWSVLLFDALPRPAQIAGGLLVLAGVMVAMLAQD